MFVSYHSSFGVCTACDRVFALPTQFDSRRFPLRKNARRNDRYAEGMHGRRYTILIADRTSGVVRRATIRLRPTVAAIITVLALPILIGLGAKRSAGTEIEQLRTVNALLQAENKSYRTATGELTTQIQSL